MNMPWSWLLWDNKGWRWFADGRTETDFFFCLFPLAFKNSAGRSGGEKSKCNQLHLQTFRKIQGKGLMLWKGKCFGDIQWYSLGKREFNTYCSAYRRVPTVPIELVFFHFKQVVNKLCHENEVRWKMWWLSMWLDFVSFCSFSKTAEIGQDWRTGVKTFCELDTFN